MKRTIITTVGTSLLTNQERPWAGWRNGQPLPGAQIIDQWLNTADMVMASAETHTWHRLSLFEDGGQLEIQVVLVYSQTAEGEFCADRLKELAIAKGISGRVQRVDGLSYSEGVSFNRALRQLAHVIAVEVRRGRASGSVELAATGGFKAEIAVANLVGAVLDTPVHYIYEKFQELVTLEPIPVCLRPDWLTAGCGRALLEHLSSNDIVPVSSLESFLKADERLRTLIEFDESKELVSLSLLGELAAQLIAPQEGNWPPTTDDEPARKVRLDSAAHHRPRGWETITDKLARSKYVTSVRYEGSNAGGCLRDAPDNYSDLIHQINDGKYVLTLRVSTTATTSEERRLVQSLLRREIGN